MARARKRQYSTGPILTRLISKISVNSATDCWEWTGTRNQKGYGILHIKSVSRPAHRISYQIYRGDIPDGMLVCHSCDNTGCVNPAHLFVGTNIDNMADMVAKGRQNKCKGMRNGRAKLSEATVLAIRSAEGMTHKEIAGRFGATITQVSDIRLGRSWKHLRTANG